MVQECGARSEHVWTYRHECRPVKDLAGAGEVPPERPSSRTVRSRAGAPARSLFGFAVMQGCVDRARTQVTDGLPALLSPAENRVVANPWGKIPGPTRGAKSPDTSCPQYAREAVTAMTCHGVEIHRTGLVGNREHGYSLGRNCMPHCRK
jgi:hypothetical protein